MQAKVEAIYFAGERHGPQEAVPSVQLIAGEGIVGDRYFGTLQQHPGQNLTLIEAEEIERFNREHDVNYPLSATRRNLVTRDVRLNALVGKEFLVGNVLMRGVELCKPCQVLGQNLTSGSLTQTQVVAAFLNRGGLRADVLLSGTITVGDALKAV